MAPCLAAVELRTGIREHWRDGSVGGPTRRSAPTKRVFCSLHGRSKGEPDEWRGLVQGLPYVELGFDAADNIVGEVGGAGLPTEIGGANAAVDRFKGRFVDSAAGLLRFGFFDVREQGCACQDHRHRISHGFALQSGRCTMRRFSYRHADFPGIVKAENL